MQQTGGGDVVKSLVIIPPALAASEELVASVRSALVARGFVIIREESRGLTSDTAAQLVPRNAEWAHLVGTARLLAVARVNATEELQSLPKSLNLLALVVPTNSDAAMRQLLLLFPRMSVGGIPTSIEAHEYVDTFLKPILITALTLTAKTKPENPVKFVAEYLLNNNPNKPPVVRPEDATVA